MQLYMLERFAPVVNIEVEADIFVELGFVFDISVELGFVVDIFA